MKLSLVEVALWAANSILNVALVLVLVFRKRWRVVPWFTVWMSYGLLYALACFLDLRIGSKQSYRWVYWLGALGDFLLQIVVVLEIARSALKHDGAWLEGVRRSLLPFLVLAPIVAAGLAVWITPAAASDLDGIATRASLFTTVLVCFLFAAVVRATQQLGLDWRSFVARESLGLTIWTVMSFITDSLHAYWRTAGYFNDLENVRIVTYQLVMLYWCIAFWIPEPKAISMPADFENRYLERLQG